jgi:predicted HTH transcriptional regulator
MYESPSYADMEKLVLGLASAAHETEWLEFKRNLEKPEDIGAYISALSNSAALHGEARGFVVWGVDDATHEIVGTSFDPAKKKKGNELLESWLARLLSPRIDFSFHCGTARGHPVVVLEIPAAVHTPTRFSGEEYVRVGSVTKKLREFPEKERKLWHRLTHVAFEDGVARHGLTAADVLSLLEVSEYFALSGQQAPSTPDKIIERLVDEEFVAGSPDGTFGITNLGAISFGRPLKRLKLDRKGVRVVAYEGVDRHSAVRQQEGQRGYIAGFKGLMEYVMSQLPSNEVIGSDLRIDAPLYPEVAVRELVANALIHQDFSITGTGPLIEIFDGRIEITNPGRPLIDAARILDSPPRSRNEKLASMMRKFRYAEERGSGIDRVVALAEAHQLPAPDFRVTDDHFVATLYARRPYNEMTKEDRIRACYQHACLQWVARTQLTNASLRKRFGISEGNSAMASRIIADTEAAGQIRKYNPEKWSRKHASYVPFWA